MPFCSCQTNNLVLSSQELFHKGFIREMGEDFTGIPERKLRGENAKTILLLKSFSDFLNLLCVAHFVVREESEPLIEIQTADERVPPAVGT